MRKTAKQYAEERWAKVLLMPKIECACGCGTLIPPLTKNYQPVKYVKGHQAKGNQTRKGSVPHNRIGDKPLTTLERQKRHMEKKYAEIALMPKIPCKCGCGTMIAPITTDLKPAQYAHGHNPSGLSTRFVKGQKAWNEGIPNPSASLAHKGKKLSQGEIEQRTKTRLERHGGIYQVARGWKHAPETLEKMRGKNNHHWHGGRVRSRYGFTDNLKASIRNRDDHTCMRCGKVQSDLNHTIEVHHLDHNPSNNSPMNLVCACHPCNVWASFHRDQEFVNAEIAIRIWNRLILQPQAGICSK